MDSLLEKRAWGKGYVTNPFCYLTEDITQFSDRDLVALKDCFKFHYQKYEKFKKLNAHLEIPTYEKRMITLMKHPTGSKDQELMLEIEEERISGELKKELKDLSTLKLDYWRQASENSSKATGGAAKFLSK